MAGTEEQTSVGEPLDLAALGKTWTPPQANETTPEVSEILAEMPWWAARGLLYIIVAILLAAGLWAHFSVLDVVAEARGTLLPEGYTRRVEAQTDGVVQFILVREGDRVEANEALIQLDSAEARVRRDNGTVAPDRPVITAYAREFPPRPGMTATSEVVTDRKSVLSLFLAPFKKVQGDLGSAK